MQPTQACSPVHQALLQGLGSPVHHTTWVVGLSGGLDSVCLLRACLDLGLTVHAVHVNHHLQPAAEQFQQFCEQLCQAWQVPLQVLPVQVDLQQGTGLEAAARLARYTAVGQWMLSQGLQRLLTAHHQDDQLETVLLQLFRGSGLRGVAGMPTEGAWPIKGEKFRPLALHRPLLTVPRPQLEQWAQQQQLQHVNDPSNSDITLRRNWLRQVLLPDLQRQFPQHRQGILRLAQFVQQHHHGVDDAVGELLNTQASALDLQVWLALATDLRAEALRAWLLQQGVRCSKNQLLELQRQLVATAGQGGVRQVCKPWRLRIQHHQALVERLPGYSNPIFDTPNHDQPTD